MKNNKGFTLAELLSIIVLISVFALIAGPNLTKQIQSSEEEGKNVLTQNIENASMIYAGKYYANELISGDEVSFSLDDLISDGLLELNDKECAAVRDKDIIFPAGEDYSGYLNITTNDCFKRPDEE